MSGTRVPQLRYNRPISGTRRFPWSGCGVSYRAVRADTSRFCSDRCRKRNLRAPKPKPVNGQTAAPAPRVDGSLAEIIRAELQALGLDATTPGHLALDLAQRIDAPNTSDASRAPMAREVMRLRAELLRTVVDEDDPVHILQQRVAAKKNGDEQASAYWEQRRAALPPSIRNPHTHLVKGPSR
jgi:hypothetical protein